jgi:hypothetical protein
MVKTMSRQVLPNNQEDREVHLGEHDAGQFIEAVSSTQTKKTDTLIVMLDAFWNEPELLYVALGYARDQGVMVTMAPPSNTDEVTTLRSDIQPTHLIARSVFLNHL